MTRSIVLVFVNEFRLLARDRVGIFMLVLAPIVIIAVAGFSLGNLYGTRSSAHAYVVAVVDQDRGNVARAIIAGLGHEKSIEVVTFDDPAGARRLVGSGGAPIGIVIPPETSRAFAEGRTARLQLYVDPVERIEANAIELRLNELTRQISARTRARARSALKLQSAATSARLRRLAVQVAGIETMMARYRVELARGRTKTQAELRLRMSRMIAQSDAATQAEIDRSMEQNKAALNSEMAARGAALTAVKSYLEELRTSQAQFDRWFAALKRAAGSHAAQIPPPPSFPTAPRAQLDELSKPLRLPSPRLPHLAPPPRFSIELPALPRLTMPAVPHDLIARARGGAPVLPGGFSWRERSAGGPGVRANAFDQYVPGFGITFLFIAMLMAIGMGLIDERDWGTLARLRVSGAPLSGIIAGKLVARFVVGLFQMIVLFAVGWALFGISLGSEPLMLLLPTAAIAFAAAAISLLIACVARTHDSVMPIGAVVAMALAAIGGCWWPLDFEPSWMRAAAQWLPTTWAMRAYNDLMIRHLPASSALWPSAATAGIAIVCLIVGLIAAARVYE